MSELSEAQLALTWQDYSDADALNRAAAILRERSNKPKGFWLGFVTLMLERVATNIRTGRRWQL